MIYIASDHTGKELKDNIIAYLKNKRIRITDKSKENQENDDYPDIAYVVCKKIKQSDFAIAICGTGIGISIAANKIKGVRAAVCTDEYMAKMARLDNDANVLCLGSRTKSGQNNKDIMKIVEIFINTKFSSEERHLRRINKIKEMEKN